MRKETKEDLGCCLAGGVIILVLIAFLYGMAKATLWSRYVAAAASVEQLRKDVRSVDVSSNEDVMGQVTQWNQTIAEMRAYRQEWGWCSLVPANWDTLEPIELEGE